MTDKVVGLYGEIGIAGIKELKRDLRALNKELEVTTKKMDRKSLQQKIESKDERLRAANARKQEARDRKRFAVTKAENKFNRQLLSTKLSDSSFQDIMEKFTSAKKKFMAGDISKTDFDHRVYNINERLLNIKREQTSEENKKIALSKELSRVEKQRQQEAQWETRATAKEIIRLNTQKARHQERVRSTRRAGRSNLNFMIDESGASPERVREIKRAFALLNLQVSNGQMTLKDYSAQLSQISQKFRKETARQSRMSGAETVGNEKVDLAIRNSKASQAQVAKFRKEFQLLNAQLRSGQIGVTQYKMRVDNLARSFKRASREGMTLSQQLKSLRSGMIALGGAYTLIAGVRHIAEISKGFESVESAMLAATGSMEESGKQMDYLRGLSKRLGISVLDLGDAYAKLSFSSKGKMSTDDIQELFTGLTEFGRVMGVSDERMKFAMMAVQQMANKGTVSMEELKRQLSENLPGSMQVFAKAMGVGEEEMIKMIETGKVMSFDVLPAFGKELRKAANEGGALEQKLKGLRTAEGQMKVDWQDFIKAIGDSGFNETLAELYRGIGDLLTALKPVFVIIVGFLSGFISSLTWVIRLIASIFGDLVDLLGPDGLQAIGDVAYFIGQIAGFFVNIVGGAIKIMSVVLGPLFKQIFAIIKALMPAMKKANIVQSGTSGVRHNIAGAVQFAARNMSMTRQAQIGAAANTVGTISQVEVNLSSTPELNRLVKADARKGLSKTLDGGVK